MPDQTARNDLPKLFSSANARTRHATPRAFVSIDMPKWQSQNKRCASSSERPKNVTKSPNRSLFKPCRRNSPSSKARASGEWSQRSARRSDCEQYSILDNSRTGASYSSNELKNHGAEDVLIAIVDGLNGFREAITAAFPETQMQTCVVHLIRHSLAFVSYKDRKTVAAALKEICKAKDAEAGLAALDDFAEGPWNKKYAAITQSWRRAWGEVKLRRAVRARGHFPTDDSAMKLLYLVLNLTAKEWKMPPREWMMAKAQFAILFGGRFVID
jgi:hypothetical protein